MRAISNAVRIGRLEALGIGHEENVLGDGAHDVGDRRLLERVGTDRGRRHLAADHDDGHGVRDAVAHRRHRIRGTGAGGDQAHADASARPRVSRGHEPGALLVRGNDQRHRTYVLASDAILVVAEDGVVGREDRAAAVTEDDVHALVGEHLDDHVGAGKRLTGLWMDVGGGDSLRVVHG